MRVTLRQIAEATGYSKSTVSMALADNKRLADETRREIQRKAADMGYRHNPVVAHLMAQLSRSQEKPYQATLALLNIEPDAHAFDLCGAVKTWVVNAERRALELGYRVDSFWLQEPGLDGKKLARIFRARNIAGVLVINSCAANELPETFNPVWETFSCIIVGNRIARPPLNFVCNDQYLTALECVKHAAGLGYRRPGLVMCPELDRNVELKFSGGFQKGVEWVYGETALPVLTPEGPEDAAGFRQWLKANKPDAVLSIVPWPAEWIKSGRQRPGLISLDRMPDMPDWPGMDQNNETVGAVATEQLIGQLHRDEMSLPRITKSVFIQSTWHDIQHTP